MTDETGPGLEKVEQPFTNHDTPTEAPARPVGVTGHPIADKRPDMIVVVDPAVEGGPAPVQPTKAPEPEANPVPEANRPPPQVLERAGPPEATIDRDLRLQMLEDCYPAADNAVVSFAVEAGMAPQDVKRWLKGIDANLPQAAVSLLMWRYVALNLVPKYLATPIQQWKQACAMFGGGDTNVTLLPNLLHSASARSFAPKNSPLRSGAETYNLALLHAHRVLTACGLPNMRVNFDEEEYRAWLGDRQDNEPTRNQFLAQLGTQILRSAARR